MTLQKSVNPDTLKGVSAAYIEIIGAKRAAAIAGVTDSMVYHWANSDHGSELTDLTRLADLDRACIERGHPPPFAAYWDRLLGRRAGNAERLEISVLRMDSVIGAVDAAVVEAISNDGPGGEKITPNEANAIRQHLARAQEAVNSVRRAVDAACPNTAENIVWAAANRSAG